MAMLTAMAAALAMAAAPQQSGSRPAAVSTPPAEPAVAVENLRPRLRVRGMHLVDPQGRPVLLEGPNLGNWFLLEMWMMSLGKEDSGAGDQYELEQLLAQRFGESERHRLMELWRENWIRDEDFAIIRSFGFNAVRLPMNYRQFEDDARPMALRPDAWNWVDRALSMARRHGLYVILDLHGVQGGQSVFDHTGRAGQNQLWTSESNRARLAWLWREIARRYRHHPNVAAYDVINEPFGGTHGQQLAVFREVYAAIREVDLDTLIYIPGHTDGFDHYGDPRRQGWRNVGFTMHYYPGLFGNGNPTELTHARHLRRIEPIAERIRELDVPFLVGEMNVVFDRAGGPAMMRRTFDAHRRFGWSTTLWSYRVSSTDGGHGDASWGMVTNPGPVRRIDFRTASAAEIEAWIRWWGEGERQVKEPLRNWMTDPNPQFPPLPEEPDRLVRAPADQPIPGWRSGDVGRPRPGGQRPVGTDGADVWGAGRDIWGSRDDFRFVWREVEGDFTFEATVASLTEVGSYTKAGLMARASDAPDAATLLFSTFPSGGLQVAFRPADGGNMDARAEGEARFPDVRLRMTRRGGVFETAVQADGAWRTIGRVEWATAPARLRVGLVAMSNDDGALAEARYRRIILSQP